MYEKDMSLRKHENKRCIWIFPVFFTPSFKFHEFHSNSMNFIFETHDTFMSPCRQQKLHLSNFQGKFKEFGGKVLYIFPRKQNLGFTPFSSKISRN